MQITELLNSKDVVAITSTEFLEPALGKGTTVQPATYADHGYVISGDIAVVDSVQSQANRLEAIFKKDPYNKLVPQVVVNHMNLLDLGHRAADAVVRYSSANPSIRKALEAAAKGDFTLLAKVNPTALLLGVWDSRNNGVKVARVLGFTVDANGVSMVRHRAAQYRASIDPETKAMLHTQHLNTEGSSEKKSRTKLSEEGFNDVPSFNEHLGGCIAEEIVRRGVLNFIPLRKYDETLQKYLLGLGLVMLTYPLDHDYRSGTLLVQDPERLPKFEIVYRSGKRESIQIAHEAAIVFAQASAVAFGVGQSQSFVLNNETYKQYQKSGAAEKKPEQTTKKTTEGTAVEA